MVIPNKLQDRVLKELHDGHMGVVKMKALARSYVWLPNINAQLEELANYSLKRLNLANWKNAV